ncbi:MAG: DUF2520 domain-containing protein [Selenomonas sp.]|nr:DUF2520 domain-containing protein [Selenomonas sp.]
MKIGFIGAGKVGFSLGKYFHERGYEVAGYYSRTFQSAVEAAAFTASDVYATRSELVAASDVLFLTVPDGAIATEYAALCQNPIQGKIICHCSGALTAEAVFPDIEQRGAAGFAVHPLVAVSSRRTSYRELADVFFTLEGTASRLPAMQAWLSRAGLHVQHISAAAKIKYHCAAAMASNQAAVLFAKSQQLLEECGFSAENAQAALGPLFFGNARHVVEEGPVAALTGPVERADLGTVAKHLNVLAADDDKMLYLLLSKQLLCLAGQKHPDRDYRSIQTFIDAETGRLRQKG